MGVEIKNGLSRRNLRKLMHDPDTVYVNIEETREYRVIGVRSGEAPHNKALLVQRFDLQNGQWRVSSEGARFGDCQRSQRSIAMMALVKDCNRRRV